MTTAATTTTTTDTTDTTDTTTNTTINTTTNLIGNTAVAGTDGTVTLALVVVLGGVFVARRTSVTTTSDASHLVTVALDVDRLHLRSLWSPPSCCSLFHHFLVLLLPLGVFEESLLVP